MRSELLGARPDFGRIVPWVREIDERTTTAIAGPDAVCLRSNAALYRTDGTSIAAEFTVAAGDRVWFDLAWFPLAPRAAR